MRVHSRALGAATAITLHLFAGGALLSYEPERSALLTAAPIMVDLLMPAGIEPKSEPPAEIMPPKPTRIMKPRPKPPEPLPVITAPLETPSPVVARPPAPEPAPEPEPVVAAPSEPVVAAPLEASEPVGAARPAPMPLLPVTPAIFNADYLDNPPPAYPGQSRRIGEQGRVILRVLVNPSGSADEVQVRTSSGHSRLDEAARETVRRWKFVPAKRGEQPVAAWVLIPISFRLEG